MDEAFGRLDVFLPGGEFRTHTLREPQITVGASEASTIQLDVEGVSGYHFSLDYEAGQVNIIDRDSTNGTYVDGVRLTGQQPQPLYGGEEIQAGEARLLYTFLDETPTRPVSVPEESTRRIEVEAQAFRVDLNGPAQAVTPGAHISSELTITNTGEEPLRFVIDVAGLPLDWVRLDHPEVIVKPDDFALVVISFKPLRRSDSTPGDYPVTITVRPRHETYAPLQAHMTLRVLPYSGFGMALEKHRLGPSGSFRLHLHNQGSAPLPISLSKRDRGDALNLTLDTPQLVLAPGQRQLVEGHVRPLRQPLFGQPRQHSFDLVVRSGDASGFLAATRAYVVEKPLLPGWAAYALAGAAVLTLAAAALMFVLVLARPVAPQLDDFTVSDVRLTQGEPLDVRWDVRHADEVTLHLNGTPVLNGDGTLSRSSLDTSGYLGDVTVMIEARGGGGQASASEVVSIIAPMQVEFFTVSPPFLVEYVFQPLTISWSVPGASRTALVGLDDFLATSIQAEPLQDAYGPTAELANLLGYPTGSALTISLVARDSDGNELTETRTINVIEPVCVAEGDAAPLYSGPGTAYQVIGTVPAGTAVVVDAQDPDGGWLRVAAGDGARPGWGELGAFVCRDFDATNLRKVFDIPTPIPPTPAATEPSAPLTLTTPAAPTVPTSVPTSRGP